MFVGLLPDTAEVFRRRTRSGEQTTDRLGQPTRDEEPFASYRCRITNARGGKQMGERTHDVIVTSHTLFLEAGADIREDDLVTVVNAEGREQVTKAEVVLVREVPAMRSFHHVEVKLETHRPSRGTDR